MPRIIITGASDGIGAEMARQLAQTHQSQLQLTLAARNASNLQTVADQCRALRAQVLTVPTDVGEEAQCRALIEKAFYGDLSHSEISEQTGLPMGTVKSRIRLALDKLRQTFEGERG